MKDKRVKENDDFIWFENAHGIGYVVSKHAFFQEVALEAGRNVLLSEENKDKNEQP